MIKRDITAALHKKTVDYPVVFLTGPRQSGKSTLLKNEFSSYHYVSLEDPDYRLLAQSDPRGFLATYPDKTIIDEAQHAPELFSYIQTRVDQVNDSGMYVLSGSQNFLLMQSITQSFAGRVGVLKLLPFSHGELDAAGMAPPSLDEWLFTGGYPRIYDKGIIPTGFYPDYLQTYLERDVRLLRNIVDLSGFLRFVKLCAGRTGQLLNVSALADACDISAQTVRAWLSVLEASYLVFFVQPYYRNFNKRLTKSPKLYFYDTGLVCSLLGIQSSEQLTLHYLRGALFENMVISEYLKHRYAEGVEPQPYFWRDNNETEIDLLVEDGAQLKAYEIKSSATMKEHFFKSLDRFSRYVDVPLVQKAVIFNGDKAVQTSHGSYLPWRDMNSE